MKKIRYFFRVILAVSITACVSTGGGVDSGAEISARAAIGQTAQEGPLFEGAGGADLRLAVLAPETQNLGPLDLWLPVYIQGMLNTNIKKYSAITLIDRQNLNQVLAEQGLAGTGNYSDQDYVSIGQLTNARYILAGLLQGIPGGQYAVQLFITDIVTGVRTASVMKNGSAVQVQNGTLVNEASEELLSQIGVQLTEAGRAALLRGRAASVRAETGFAKGVAAEQSGDAVEALLNYTQSIAFDSSQLEALVRLADVSREISGGTVSARILSDIEARRSWLAAFKTAAAFFREHPPFEIAFDPSLIQEGETDYARERVNLAMHMVLSPSEAGFDALNALVSGLDKTGRREQWGFRGWPLLDIEPAAKDTLVFEGKRVFSFTVNAALVNERGKTIARGTVTLNSGAINFAAGDKAVAVPAGDTNLLRFPNVSANDLTPSLTIVIKGVNGISGDILSRTGYINIAAENGLAETIETIETIEKAGFVKIAGGTFQMGSNNGDNFEKPVHTVTVSDFYMGKYEVTQKEWVEVMGTTAAQQRDKSGWSSPLPGEGDNYPMYYVNWYEAVEYCNRRSRKEGLVPAYRGSGASITCDFRANGYRLPTEAEWEYAAKGGNRDGPAYEYSGSNRVGTVAWYDRNSGNQTHAVGTKQANSLGLYDMSGNVAEWCWDWYGAYGSGAQTDPTGAVSGSSRVLRGGNYSYDASRCAVFDRGTLKPDNVRYTIMGFRVVCPQLE